MKAGAAIAAAILASLLAGCGSKAPAAPSVPAQTSALLAEFGAMPARRGDLNSTAWQLAVVQANGTTPLLGVHLLDEGANWTDTDHPYLGVVPIVADADRDAVEAWGVTVFETRSGHAAYSGDAAEWPFMTSTYGYLDPAAKRLPIQLSPVSATLPQTGSGLEAIIAVKSTRPIEFGVAFLASGGDVPDAAALRSDTMGPPSVAREVGTGAGWDVHAYLEIHFFVNLWAWTDGVTLVDEPGTVPDVPLPARAPDRPFSLCVDSARGVSGQVAALDAMGNGEWAVEANVHGTRVNASGTHLDVAVGPYTAVPQAQVLATGAVGSHACIRIQGDPDGFVRAVLLSDWGTAPDELLGVPVQGVAEAASGPHLPIPVPWRAHA